MILASLNHSSQSTTVGRGAGGLEMPERSKNVLLSKEVHFSVCMWFCTVCVFRHPLGLGAQCLTMGRRAAASLPLCLERHDIRAGRAGEQTMVVFLYQNA